MALNITPVTNHREREKGLIVYPVYSRRSEGLSIGINLFLERKICPFDCPYCEVFPFSSDMEFSHETMERELRAALASAQEQKVRVRDICFSGNGEPSLSPFFPEALKRAGRIRAETVPGAELVLITNGSGLLEPGIFSLLRDAAFSLNLNIWLKADAGTPDWYGKMNCSEIPFEKLIQKIREFSACAPVTIQTMICKADGKEPPPEEARAWVSLITELAAGTGTGLRKVQIYGKARPAPEDPKTEALPAKYLEERAASLRSSLDKNAALSKSGALAKVPPVEVYP